MQTLPIHSKWIIRSVLVRHLITVTNTSDKSFKEENIYVDLWFQMF
jgi:hypothetical protein